MSLVIRTKESAMSVAETQCPDCDGTGKQPKTMVVGEPFKPRDMWMERPNCETCGGTGRIKVKQAAQEEQA
jgi:DnaJ-class molecular chaperone